MFAQFILGIEIWKYLKYVLFFQCISALVLSVVELYLIFDILILKDILFSKSDWHWTEPFKEISDISC